MVVFEENVLINISNNKFKIEENTIASIQISIIDPFGIWNDIHKETQK